MSVLISIIIPVYNVEKYLSQCLDSIFSQDFTDYEVICVNDGSTDNSLKILRQYEQKHQNLHLIDKQNGGTAAARNAGLKIAQGDYTWFIDSDDWIEPDSLRILAENLTDDPDIVCFNGKLWYENSGKIEFDEIKPEKFASGWDYYNQYALASRKFHFVCVVLRLYKTEFIRKHQLFFDTSVTHEDNLWIPKVMYYAGKLQCISDKVYIYRIREGSKMQTQSPQRIFDIVTVANKLAEFFNPITGIDKRKLYREIAGEYFKGFVPAEQLKYGKNDNELRKRINWKNYKTVSIYPRHRRIYFLLKIHPVLFRIYFNLEKRLKS